MAKWKRFAMTTGNVMMDQFMPWYFGVAFAFCFKYCTGMPDMPDFAKVPRHRRKQGAPTVDLPLWTRIITRRCEIALSKAWDLGFCMSSLLFQSTLNMSRTVFAFEDDKRDDGGYGFEAKELETAACEICHALSGTYIDTAGRKQQVKGDLTKVRLVKLSHPARRILDRVFSVARKIPGTNEVRTIMRYDTHAARIAQGVPLFITFSPDEKQNLLILRLGRARHNDPAVNTDTEAYAKKHGAIDQPSLDEDLLTIDLATLREKVPTYDERRSLIARDALASVDGFRTIVQLCLEYMFGMRFCVDCPNCICADLFGSNAEPEGGIAGRVDGIYGSVETQKAAGSLHVHMQVFVQCLHQHTPLHRHRMSELVKDYCTYKNHTCKQTYADLAGWEKRRDETEKAWPNYVDCLDLISTPASLKVTSQKSLLFNVRWSQAVVEQKNLEQEATEWLHNYLFVNVQRRQELRQNHVHVWNEHKGMRMPLTHCQSPDNVMKCKAHYPRTTWLVDESLVLCKGFLQDRHMPWTGKKNLQGALHGPMNEESLNGCMPAMLAGCPGLNFNNDVQIPYRFPIMEETHASSVCCKPCWKDVDENEMILAAQTQQNAQAGYAADYQCKRGARGFNEVKEAKKGHHALAEKIQDKRISYIGHRHVTRILSDCYGRAIVRSNQESINLRVYSDVRDVTAAESFKTTKTVMVPGAEALRLVERFNGTPEGTSRRNAMRAELDVRDKKHVQLVSKNLIFPVCMSPFL